MPDPTVIGPATYLFAVLALAADFLEGLPVIIAAALTFILWQKAPARMATSQTSPGHTGTPAGTPAGVRGPVGAPVKPSMNLGAPPGVRGPVGANAKPIG